jgi:hypothetical protein
MIDQSDGIRAPSCQHMQNPNTTWHYSNYSNYSKQQLQQLQLCYSLYGQSQGLLLAWSTWQSSIFSPTPS